MAQLKRVYVVEDDPLTSSLVCTMLRKKPNTEVFSFDDGSSALDACKKHVPDILIVDYQLPGMSGIDLFDAVKSHLPPSTVVIMASAIDDGAMVLKFIQKGIRNYVIKDDKFIDALQDILAEEGAQ